MTTRIEVLNILQTGILKNQNVTSEEFLKENGITVEELAQGKRDLAQAVVNHLQHIPEGDTVKSVSVVEEKKNELPAIDKTKDFVTRSPAEDPRKQEDFGDFGKVE